VSEHLKIVVDSIAAPMRSQYDKSRLSDRAQLLGKIASSLKYLGETFAIPTVVTNQVTTKLVAPTGMFTLSWCLLFLSCLSIIGSHMSSLELA
jgi:RecA/RadA recombinase